MSAPTDFTFHGYSGEEILEVVDELASLRIEVFREFPYLYEGDLEYEKKYLQTYIRSERSRVWMLEKKGIFVGATTCIPMADESEEFKKDFIDKGFDVNRIFYFGESIIKKEHRGSRIGPSLFEYREEHARKMISDLEYTCFAAIDRADHPLKPLKYRPLDEFWNRLGYVKNTELRVDYPWTDVGETKETLKTLFYWMKKWTV